VGGNARAIDRKTGRVKAYANQIDLQKIGRKDFVIDLLFTLKSLNDAFLKHYNETIWDFNIIVSGLAFNGSSELLINTNIDDDTFIKYKRFIGDIDITVPHEKLKQIFDFLSILEDKKIGEMVYLGQCKPKFYGYQINSVWKYKDITVQIDFEGTSYENEKPTEFAKFSHSSKWIDVENGFKGVHHKYLLTNIIRTISENDQIMILTPKSKLDLEKARIKKLHEPPRMLAFSIDRGLRQKYKMVDLIFEGKQCFKELPTEKSEYETNIEIISKKIFGFYDNRFWSFTGLLDMFKEVYGENEKLIKKLYYYLWKQLWGSNAQALFRNDPSKDYKIKRQMMLKFCGVFSKTKDIYDESLKKIRDNFYKKYKMVKIID